MNAFKSGRRATYVVGRHVEVVEVSACEVSEWM